MFYLIFIILAGYHMTCFNSYNNVSVEPLSSQNLLQMSCNTEDNSLVKKDSDASFGQRNPSESYSIHIQNYENDHDPQRTRLKIFCIGSSIITLIAGITALVEYY